MSFLRRSYTDGPTESQKLYGSELPPSLRWGAARKHAGPHGPEAVYQSDFRSNFPPIPRYAARAEYDQIGGAAVGALGASAMRLRNRSRRRGSTDEERAELRLERRRRSRSRGRGDASSHASEGRGRSSERREFHRRQSGHLEHLVTDAQGLERERRPYAVGSSTKDRAKPLLLRDAPEDIDTEGQRDAEKNLIHASGRSRRSKLASTYGKEHAVAVIGGSDTSKRRISQAPRRDSRSDTRLSAEAGAERSDDPSNGDRTKYRIHDSRREAQSWSPRPRQRRPAINAPRYSENQRPRHSRRDRPRSNSSGRSYSTWTPRVSQSWFFQSWSVRPQKGRIMQSTGTEQTSPLSTSIVTEVPAEPQPKTEAAPTVPSPFQRVRSWRYNQVLPAIETTLKRVVHATYGDLLQDEALKGPDPTGFIAVPQSCSSQGDTLYHVLNLQQSHLDFEAFKNAVVNLPELRKVRESVNAHFDKAQRLYEHRAHDRDAARSMNGFCHHTEASAGQARMILVGLPFVQLKQHNHRTEAELNSLAIVNRLLRHSRGSQANNDQAVAQPDTAHATRTLFQYLNPRDNSRRDLKQVVCHMLGPRDKRYLCISQIWIFVANEDLIITSSTLPESDLCGDLLLPLTAQTTPLKGSLVNVHVVSEDGRQWLLRAADCLTYIDFAANFSDVTHQFAEDFDVYHDDEEVKPSDWSQKMQQASTATLRVELRRLKPSDFATRSQPIWSSRSGRFREKWIPESRAITDRMILMLRSSNVWVLGFVGQEERSELDRPFRKFLAKLQRYQVDKDRSRDDAANESTEKTHDDAKPTVKEPPKGRSSDAGWPVRGDTQQGEDKTSRSDSEHAESDRHSIDYQNEGDQWFDMIYVLPKAAIKAQVLSDLGISFIEQTNDFTVAEGLDESRLFDVMQMKHKLRNLEGLRKMTCECLLRTPTSDLNSPHLETDALNPTVTETGERTSSRKHRRAAANVFNEDTMYKTCPELTRAAFHDKLRTWMAAPLPDTSVHPDRVVGIPSPDLNLWGLRRLLGWSFPRHINVATGESMYISPQRIALFENVLDGFWLTLKTSKLTVRTFDLQIAEEKLLGAVHALVTSIHESMERAEELPYHVFYYSVSQHFTRLFKVMNDLETHAVTIETIYKMGKSAPSRADYAATLRHITIALLLAAKTLSELEDQTDVLEAEKLRRNEALAKISSTADRSADYIHVEECCDEIFGARKKKHRQKRFRRSIDHLESLGWNRAAARTILLNECRRRRITHHADLAARMLETSFLKVLTQDSSNKIQWKAAALPTDLVALLITQVLEKPVLDGQDALNMYMRYVTDLESNILTGEPSREPLDRIRYLRHELNAFSQLQQEQIDVLEKVTSALLSSNDTQNYYYARDDPHPRRTVFAALPKGIQIQKDIIQSLSDMLDDLQSEARAQILSVQDWRDNAAVVFTIITVIFLPLSFVASVFGMNTSDVRNMELSQWVFWTCAIVFTVIVVLITVYFVDVPPLWRWLERKGGDRTADKVPQQSAQRGRSHFFAGLARHSGGIAAADDGAGLDARQEQLSKGRDVMTSSEEESSSSSDDEARPRRAPSVVR